MKKGKYVAGIAVFSAMCYAMVMMTMLSVTGCKPLTPAQIKVVAQQTGMFSAVGWIAIDNPNAQTKIAVSDVIAIIGDKAAGVEAGQTYTEVLYPVILDYVANKVEKQYQPLTKAGALALLGGIDMLFAGNPTWHEDSVIASEIVQSFCLGASSGLGMAADHPVIKAATRNATMRAGLNLPKK